MGSKNLRLAELASNVDAAGEYTGTGSVQVYTAIADFPTSGNAAGDIAFADSSNLLYIYSGEGWYNIGLINQTPTITSGGAGSYTLATDGTPTIITLIAEDPEGFPITWSFTATGLDSEATVTQGTGDSANVFTITPTTDADKSGDFSVTFTASDGVNIATDINSFTLSFGDQDLGDVIALLQTDKDAFSRDASTSVHQLQENGDVKPTSFSPYRGSYYSNYFDGSGDYLTVAGSNNILNGTGDFTIECWVYLNTVNGFNIIQQSDGTSGYVNKWTFAYYSGNLRVTGHNPSGTPLDWISRSWTPTANVWYHLAVTRESNVHRLWVDGTQLGSDSTVSTGIPSITSDAYIAKFKDNPGSSADLDGYISSLRVTNGTALYTAAFTPSTSPLTTTSQGATASEVSLLTCQSNRFIDNSSNAFSITVNGDTAVSGHTPFSIPTSYAEYGSSYFDGSGDYFVVPANDDFVFDDGDFAIEAWIYPTTTGVERGIVNNWQTGGCFILRLLNTNQLRLTYRTSGTVDKTSTDTVTANCWTHVAAVRNGNNIYFYINGVADSGGAQSETGTIVYYNNSPKDLKIGTSGDTGNLWNGWISDLRIVKGSAVYTSDFTPSTTLLTAVTNTKLLTLQTSYPSDCIDILDRSGSELELTVNGDINTSSFSPYSPFGYSVYMDGNGDRIEIPSNEGFDQDNPYTVEMWFYPTYNYSNQYLYGENGTARFGINWNGSDKVVKVDKKGVGIQITGTTVLDLNKWHHVAMTYDGTTTRLFADGNLEGTVAGGAGASSTTNTIGYYYGNTSSSFRGYISNFRFTQGSALYTASFTVPTSPLTATEQTSLLCCNGPTLVDQGYTRSPLTPTGNYRLTSYTPFTGHAITPDSHSNYFDGVNDYLTVSSSSDFTFGTGDFTFECWYNCLGSSPVNAANALQILDLRTAEPSITPLLYIAGSGSNYNIQYYVNGSVRIDGSPTSFNTWNHLAVSRSNGTTKMFLNGTQIGSDYTDTNNYIGTTPIVGGRFAAVSGDYRGFYGYISDARIVKGTAIYTSDFTPSTEPLTAVSGTSLLTCQSSTLIDNSSSNHTITSNGTAQPSEFNPFGFTTTTPVAYNPVIHAGSMYGDGTTDYVDVEADAWNSVGTGDFCIQFWTYSKEVDANKGQIAIGGNKIAIRFDSSNRMTFWVAGNGGPASTPNDTVYPFNWYHVCLERSGSTNTLYINGVAQASNTTTPSNDATPVIRIGGQYANNTGYTFTGWISDLSIRSKAVYKGNFVPPKQVTYGDHTKLQVPFSDAAIYDSKNQLTYEVNSLKTSSAATKFHNQSLDFTSGNDYVYTEERHGTTKVYGEKLKLGTDDFTVEFWWNFASTSGRQDLLWIGSSSTRLGIIWNLSAGQLTYYPATSAISATVSFSTDTWYHIAVSRASGYTKMFVDGTQVGSTYTDSKDFDGTILYLGKDSGASSSYSNGYMDGLRITKGVARYTSNFTAPTDAFSKQ